MNEVYTIPKQIWYIRDADGLQHQLEISFDSPIKNVALKLDEELIFDIKLKGYETVYPLRIGSNTSYQLFLRKKPVGAFECELRDEQDQHIPCYTNRPKGFGIPMKKTPAAIAFEIFTILVGSGIAAAIIYFFIRIVITLIRFM